LYVSLLERFEMMGYRELNVGERDEKELLIKA
jgi:hypothetical protein